MWAIESKNSKCVRLLLAAGAYPFITEHLRHKQDIPAEITEYVNIAKKIRVIRLLLGTKMSEIYKNIFPYWEPFDIDEYERELKVNGYKFRPHYNKRNMDL